MATDLEGLTPEQLEARQRDLIEKVEQTLKDADGTSDATLVKSALDEVTKLRLELQPLQAEQNQRMMQDMLKGFTTEVASLTESMAGMREGIRLPAHEEGSSRRGDDDLLYADGKHSMFGDILKARVGGKSGGAAYDRLEEFYTGKANEYIEGTDSAGGYLVRPEFVGNLPPRLTPFNLVDIVPQLRVSGDQVEFIRFTESASLAGWVGELLDKPQLNNQTFAPVTASVFTAAAHAIASNQLLEDSSVDAIIRAQLDRGVRRTIEDGILNGTGTAMPLGILRTPSVLSRAWADASPTVGELLPQIALAITDVMDNHLSSPTHIIMRPQTWTRIITDAAATGTFTFGAGLSDPGVRTASDPFPNKTLFGLPVVTTPLITGTNVAGVNGASTGGTEARIIVADMSEQLLLNRTDMEVDLSEHLLFLKNATVFRGERRVGFTAARYPSSIAIIHGTGLSNTVF